MFGLKTLKRLALLIAICGFATAAHSPDQSSCGPLFFSLELTTQGCGNLTGACGVIPPKVFYSGNN